MATYIVWNIENTGCATYEELLVLEQDGYSHSSSITTNAIESIIRAVLNETNADLGYHLMAPASPIPRLDDFSQEEDGNNCIIGDAVYTCAPIEDNECDGCAFSTKGLPEHCSKVACTPAGRVDKRNVIWMQHTTPYTGHEV